MEIRRIKEGGGAQQCCVISRIPYFLNNLPTDASDFSVTRRSRFTPQEASWCSFLLEAGYSPGTKHGWKD
jgi:hypothetical protein